MKVNNKLLTIIGLVLFAGLLMGACTPQTGAPGAASTPTEHPLPPTGATHTPPANTGRIEGLVWHDVCAITGGEGGAPATPSAGCVAKDGAFQANGVFDTGEPGISGVVVDLGQGACPANGLLQATTDAAGKYTFEGLPGGAYCVSIDPTSGPNVSILIPGMWTSLSVDMAEVSINLNPEEQKSGVNFGWDFQFLPLPETPAATETSGEDPEAFKAWVMENTASRNYAELQKLMTNPFWLGGWRSEVHSYPLEDAIEQVQAYFGSGDIQFLLHI